VTCDYVVNAAGPWANDVCQMAGVEIPVEPRKRCIFVFSCREEMPDGMPAVIAPNGVFCRPEGLQFLSTIEPEVDGVADRDDYSVDIELFEEHIWPTLAEVIPAFESIKVARSWAGHYEFNTFDQNGIVGPHGDIPNLILANGFSGHGLQHSPAVGRGVAEWIVYGEYRALDLTPLSHQRIVKNEPLLENLVI
jgi:glycine/D-amino acid oxidase-like deaminating enzyme